MGALRVETLRKMKTFIIFSLFGLALSQLPGQLRDETCADMPTFMKEADRIVGGEAAPSPIPWQAAVLSGTFQFCGATVLDAYTLLCAAHCTPSTSHSIRVGSTNKQSGGQLRDIAQVIYNNNEGFQYNNPTQLNNDFVILKLSNPLELNDDVKPACLPSSSDYLGVSSTEERCFTSGWGTLSSGGSSTDTLQYVRVPAITNDQCNEAYNGDITNAMICAGYPGVGGKDACQGDSGGPFVCNDNGKAVIAGVVSWGISCALDTHPGVYARTTHVLDWIKENMGEPDLTPTTAPPPPSPCAIPEWQGDGYCDDENNNEECEYDGGGCCNNSADGWNTYCEECECKDPNAGTSDCVDKWTPKRCNKKKTQGICRKTAVARSCKATCEFCGCVDIWTEERCQQKKGKCNKNDKVKEFCKMTCELC